MIFRRSLSAPGQRSQSALRDRARLPHVLDALREEAAAATAPVLQLQPVVQFCDALHYPAWSQAWQAAWRRVGVSGTKVLWPDEIPHGHTAALLVPVLPGRVGLALGRHPVPQVLPLLGHAQLPGDVAAADFALNLLLQWLDGRPPGHPVELGPPVLEFTRSARVEHREVETYGQAWPLPAPDGL